MGKKPEWYQTTQVDSMTVADPMRLHSMMILPMMVNSTCMGPHQEEHHCIEDETMILLTED